VCKLEQYPRTAPLLLDFNAILTALLLTCAALGLRFQLWLVVLIPLVGFSFALVHAFLRLGGRRSILLFTLTFTVSLLLESLGVLTGWIYGPYHYTEKLGPLFLGLVPYMVPLTWFMMTYPSYVIADRCVPSAWSARARGLAVAALGGLAMVAWDLVLDPLMTLRGHWVWDIRGAYFGVPIQNLVGWWLTTFIVLLLYQVLRRLVTAPVVTPGDSFDRLAVLSYAIIGLGNITEAWLAELAGPAILGLLVMTLWVGFGWRGNKPPS
jgi:uncharacterized membrane protein